MYLTERTVVIEEEKMYLAELTEKNVGFIFFRKLKKIKPTLCSSCPSSVPSVASVRNSCSAGLPRDTRGFSLVEVTLALMVVGVGMLAILGMFPAGLDQNARSISDTHAALFAQEVFSSLRAQAETNWQEIGQDVISLPIAASNNWHPSSQISIWLDDILTTNIYCHPDNPAIVDHAFRYRITLATNEAGTIKSAFLRFYPGKFGQTNNPTVFYSEFYRMNR